MLFTIVWLTACTTHTVKVEPVEVKPIKVTVDVNIKVDRQLDDFFDFEEEATETKPGAKVGEEAGDDI
jgi:hypothetical protein